MIDSRCHADNASRDWRPLLWSLAVHAALLLALAGLSELYTPPSSPPPLILTVQLHQSAAAVPLHTQAERQPVMAPARPLPTPESTVKKSATTLSAPRQTLPSSASIVSNPAVLTAPDTKPDNNPAPAAIPEHSGSGAPVVAAPASSPEPAEVPPQFEADFLHNPQPAYPLFARKRQQQGTVMLKVRVSSDGKPETIELAASSGYSLLDQAALHIVSTWRFVPARRGNSAISAWVTVPIQFKLG